MDARDYAGRGQGFQTHFLAASVVLLFLGAFLGNPHCYGEAEKKRGYTPPANTQLKKVPQLVIFVTKCHIPAKPQLQHLLPYSLINGVALVLSSYF